MSDRGWSCWWEISVNSSKWNVNKTVINVYLKSVQNITLWVGFGHSRESITKMTEYK